MLEIQNLGLLYGRQMLVHTILLHISYLPKLNNDDEYNDGDDHIDGDCNTNNDVRDDVNNNKNV